MREESCPDILLSSLPQAQCVGDCGGHQSRVAKWRQPYKRCAIVERIFVADQEFEGEAGFANTTGTKQRQQTTIVIEQQSSGSDHLALAADQRTGRMRQPAHGADGS